MAINTPTVPIPAIASRSSDIDVVRAALGPEYEIIEELGRGGMAVVYRARECALDREVAIKVLPAQFAFDEGFVERFQREGRISAQLEHPNVVPIHRVGRKGDVVYFAMKLLRGQSLSERLLERGRLDSDEVRRILVETAGALGYAAKRGVVHRDIKPDNIMLDEDGRCVVTDFGIARSATESKLTATGMSVGTPRYMSPEQARAGALDGRSDIYSLGVVAYECLVGTTPFHAGDAFAILMAHINEPVPRPALETADERAVFAVIERMLAKNPKDRFQSADDVVAALRSPVALAGPTPTPTVEHWRTNASKTLTSVRLKTEVVRTYVMSRTRRFWATAMAACVGLTGLYYGVHFATKHGSRCSAPVAAAIAPAATVGGPNASAATAGTQLFSVLVDAVEARKPGNDLELYYDVCGLDPGVAYTANVTIVRNESGLKRLLGRSVGPVTLTFDGNADGPAERHHKSIDFSDMPPGSYSLDLVVKDAADRRRTKATSFQVLNP